MFILTSILFGLLPESIYFTFFLIYAKQIKEKRGLLFGLIFSSNLILSAFFAFNVWYHILFVFVIYLIIWIIYKAQLIDIFVISCSILIMSILGLICYYGISNYWIAAIINRILMFTILILLKNKLHYLYKQYCSLWNRTPNAKIKSITIRNTSIIILNALLYLINIYMAIFSLRFLN